MQLFAVQSIGTHMQADGRVCVHFAWWCDINRMDSSKPLMRYSQLVDPDSTDTSLRTRLEIIYDTHAALLDKFDIPRIDVAVRVQLQTSLQPKLLECMAQCSHQVAVASAVCCVHVSRLQTKRSLRCCFPIYQTRRYMWAWTR